MTITAEQMERILAQVAGGAEAPEQEAAEAAEFRAGVTDEIENAREIAKARGLDFVVEIPNETPEMF
ncbi:predicted protein [Cyanophage PSS2]|uniref:hypothetical protein n=1 Tax=Cyanophage PSS2 TaxID=658401 RepID=UPI0001B03FF6|nr:hypothetical protein PSS2_gp033 [Cyanophage PSS2]ACT65595.1 hypothetical protein [Cyanophage PSS2]ACY75738.1 predicted protein [Cyanophage PSS2]